MVGAVRSEIRKVFTTRLWWGMALGMAVLAAGISAGFAALVGLDTGQGQGGGGGGSDGNPFAKMTVGTAQLIYNAGLVQSLTTLFPLALGVLLITGEYRHKTISATFLSTPRRWVVLVSKSIAVVVIGVVYAVVHAAASVGGGVLVLAGVKHVDTMLGNAEVWKSLGIGIVAFIIWTMFGFGFGMLVRNQIAAVLIAVGAAFFVQIALNILFAVKHWTTAAKFMPGNLTSGMLITSDPTAGSGQGSASPYFNWWTSALVMIGYAAFLAVLGSVLTSRRDVT